VHKFARSGKVFALTFLLWRRKTGGENPRFVRNDGSMHVFCGALLAGYFQYVWHDEVLDECTKIS